MRSKSVHMCYKRPDPNRKGQKNGTTNRRLANPYAKVNATRRTGIIRHCTGMFLFSGLSIYSTVSLDNGTRWRWFSDQRANRSLRWVGLAYSLPPPVPLSRDLSRHKRSDLPLLSIAKVNLLRFLDIQLSRYGFSFSF